MMVGRVIQACGNGILMTAAQVIILTVYPVEKKGTMMGTYGLATTAASGSGADDRRTYDRCIRMEIDLLGGSCDHGGILCYIEHRL